MSAGKAVPDEQVEAGAVSEEAVEAVYASRLTAPACIDEEDARRNIRRELGAALPHLHPTPDPGLSEEERGRLHAIAFGLETGFFRSDARAIADYASRSADFLRAFADRSNQPDSSKAGASGTKNSQAEEQSDDKAVPHPPAVGGEAVDKDELAAAIYEVDQELTREPRTVWFSSLWDRLFPGEKWSEVYAALASTQPQEESRTVDDSPSASTFERDGCRSEGSGDGGEEEHG